MAECFYFVNPAIKKYIWVGQKPTGTENPYLYNHRWIGELLQQWKAQPILFMGDNDLHSSVEYDDYEEITTENDEITQAG